MMNDTNTRIRKPQVAKRPWRTKGEPFDPKRVSATLAKVQPSDKAATR